MATIKTSAPKLVPQPERFKFLHGTYPPSPKPNPAPSIKPVQGNRNYGKIKPPSMPGMTGED